MRVQETKIYDSANSPVNFQPIHATAITPSDVTVFDAGVLYVGGTGNVAVKTRGGETLTFTNIANSFLLPVQVVQVLSTGTTATNMVLLR